MKECEAYTLTPTLVYLSHSRSTRMDVIWLPLRTHFFCFVGSISHFKNTYLCVLPHVDPLLNHFPSSSKLDFVEYKIWFCFSSFLHNELLSLLSVLFFSSFSRICILWSLYYFNSVSIIFTIIYLSFFLFLVDMIYSKLI